jgi:hypothetical protein
MSCLDVQESAEFRTPDNIFLKEMNLKDAGTVVRQHAHKYGHTTLLARGKLRAWRDGELLGDFAAPAQIFIPAKTKHAFVSLEADTLAYCIHRMEGDGPVEITDIHDTVDALRAVA